jgi:hypothetical protein
MAKTSTRQKRTIGRIMHEYEHGELKSGPEGKGGLVTNRRQAIAIALNDAGASKYESPAQNKRHLARAKRKEAAGATSQQEAEGKSRVGAADKRESTPAMGGENARGPARRPRTRRRAAADR